MGDVFVPLAIAVERTGISAKELTEMADAGEITIAWITTSTLENGEMAVKYEDVERLKITRDRFEKEYGDQLVSLSEAGRTLDIPKTTLQRWLKMGKIKTIPVETSMVASQEEGNASREPSHAAGDQGKDGRRTYLLRMADVAYAKAIQTYRRYEASGKTSRIFDEKGDAYHPKKASKWKKTQPRQEHSESSDQK